MPGRLRMAAGQNFVEGAGTLLALDIPEVAIEHQ